jgi:hypothetical protein
MSTKSKSKTNGESTAKRSREPGVSWEDFIAAWQASDSIGEVMERTGMKLSACTGRGVTARKKGVPLKRFRGQRSKADWDKLTDLAESLTKRTF